MVYRHESMDLELDLQKYKVVRTKFAVSYNTTFN